MNESKPENKIVYTSTEVAVLIAMIVPALLLWALIIQLSYQWFLAPLVPVWPPQLSFRASCGLAVVVMTFRGSGPPRQNERPWMTISKAIALQGFRLGVIVLAHVLLGQVR